ncbi:DUF6502 family protein [Variovorax sp. KK3]|uniref:DUF6502 family protein n=1 Tax=Variovorax sp. KK3 TaxID=1855728 RepID=UPI00211812F3|nr:DUF6502 family protein [Variovorax sp. KK3]
MARELNRSTNARPDGSTRVAGSKAKGSAARTQWVLEACARVLRPVVRIALAFGLKHAHFETLLRDLLIEEAQRLWRAKGAEPNISQLSVTTGLNRKIVTAIVREAEESLPHTEGSAAAKTLTLWLQMANDDPALRSLPLAASEDRVSFEAVARHASRGNVHHRTILDELVRLDMAREAGGHAVLNASGFVPAKDLKSMLAFLGDNVRDHLLAGVTNTLEEAPPLLERSVFASGIALADCERVHQLVRERWTTLNRELTRELTRAYEAADSHASGRIRIGIYTYYEDTAAVAQASPLAPDQRTD